MKSLKTPIIILLLILSTSINAQLVNDTETGIAVDLSIGMTNKGIGIGRFGLGAVTPSFIDTKLHSSINLQVFSNMRSSTSPAIAELREGIMIGTWEFYGGAGYHYASYDKNIDNINGFKAAYGISKKFRGTPFTITAGSSGRFFHLQFGIEGIR